MAGAKIVRPSSGAGQSLPRWTTKRKGPDHVEAKLHHMLKRPRFAEDSENLSRRSVQECDDNDDDISRLQAELGWEAATEPESASPVTVSGSQQAVGTLEADPFIKTSLSDHSRTTGYTAVRINREGAVLNTVNSASSTQQSHILSNSTALSPTRAMPTRPSDLAAEELPDTDPCGALPSLASQRPVLDPHASSPPRCTAPRPVDSSSRKKPRCSSFECNSEYQVFAEIDGGPTCLRCFARWAWQRQAEVKADSLGVGPPHQSGFATAICANPFCQVNILLEQGEPVKSSTMGTVHLRGSLAMCAPCAIFHDRTEGTMRPSSKCRLDKVGLALESATSLVCSNTQCDWDSALGIMVKLRGRDEVVRCKADRNPLMGERGLCERCYSYWKRSGESRPKHQCDSHVQELILRLLNPGPFDGRWTRRELLKIRQERFLAEIGLQRA